MITKTRLAMLIVAMVAISTTTAYATHVFTDVEDDRFYAEATEWAKDNGITFGCGDGTTFCPDDPVTRGENITFAKRYDDNIVQPALTALQGEVDATETATATNASDIDDLETLLPLFATIEDDGTAQLANRGLVSATRDSVGRYTLTWDRDVSQCAPTTNDLVFAGNFEVSADVYSGDDTQIVVVVRNAADALADTWFSIAVHCPLPDELVLLADAGTGPND